MIVNKFLSFAFLFFASLFRLYIMLMKGKFGIKRFILPLCVYERKIVMNRKWKTNLKEKNLLFVWVDKVFLPFVLSFMRRYLNIKKLKLQFIVYELDFRLIHCR